MTDSLELKKKIKDTFASGGIPTRNFVDRVTLRTELENSIDTRKIVVVTGYTKSGKTVLVKKFVETRNTIWINSGSVHGDFWSALAEHLNLPEDIVIAQECQNEEKLGASVGSQLCVPFAKTGSEVRVSKTKANSVKKRKIYSPSRKQSVIKILDERPEYFTLVIDDFHYLEESVKNDIIRSLKGVIQKGLNVIIIAIPNREHEVVSIEKEMSARIAPISVPAWRADELEQIAFKGFKYLGVDIEKETVSAMVNEAFGSPHLMQDFCMYVSLRMVDECRFNCNAMFLPTEEDLRQTYIKIANEVGRPIFSQLSKGPLRERGRKKRELKDGGDVDTYSLVAKALALLKPGKEEIKVEKLMDKAYYLLKNESERPQRFEITRVLKKMMEIAVSDSASNPVIDYDEKERRICIIDPYFAYYLKWGDCELN